MEDNKPEGPDPAEGQAEDQMRKPLDGVDSENAAKIVEMFVQLYDRAIELNNFMLKALPKSVDGQTVLSRQVFDGISLGVSMGELRRLLDVIHHKIGHTVYGRCWERVTVGEEFEAQPESDNPLSQLFSALMGGKAEIVSVGGPLAEEIGKVFDEEVDRLKPEDN